MKPNTFTIQLFTNTLNLATGKKMLNFVRSISATNNSWSTVKLEAQRYCLPDTTVCVTDSVGNVYKVTDQSNL